jgi:predicted TIM-barrel fold metal-dependent hydrolase
LRPPRQETRREDRTLATLPLYDPAVAADELRRCVGDLGFVGALIAGTYDGLFLDDARFDPILAAAETVDLPIYVHPGLPEASVFQQYYAGIWPASVQIMFSGPAFGWHAEAGIHIMRLILSGALDRHPALKLLSGHWGELAAFYLERLDETLVLVPTGLERAPRDYYRQQVWVTPSGMYNQNQLNFMTAEFGAERIIYSEDFPYVVRNNVSTFLEQAGLSDNDTHAIAHTNAEALLRI